MSASFGSLFCIASLVWLLAAVAAADANEEKCDLASLDKIDCHPEREANELECLRRGCCWRPPNVRNETSSGGGGQFDGEPSCFFRANFNCYNIAKLNEDDDANHALYQDDDKHPEDAARPPTGEHGERTKRRRRLESQRQVWLLERRADCPKSGFRDEAKRLKLELNVYGSSIINIKISEPDRWPRSFEPELPALELPEPVRRRPSPRTAAGVDKSDGQRRRRQDEGSSSGVQDDQDDSLMFGVTGIGASDDEPLRVKLNARDGLLRVIHENSGKILFETQLQQLIHSRRFIQLTTKLSSSLVYGFGQHTGADGLLKRHSKTYTMFNYGHPPQADGRTAYSSFPFYINIAALPSSQSTVSGQANSRWRQMATGALMLNANAMDVALRSSRDSRGASSVTWRLVGGLLNLFLFAGPRPHDVINQYESLVGRPTLPPAWALGYHQSRLNYNQLLQIKEAWARTRSAGIPMESVWTDLDFLREHSASYTLRDPELGQLVRCLQEEFRMHYIPIVEPAISLQLPAADYEALRLGESMNVFAYYPNGRGESSPALVGVWNERCALLDFTHAQIVPYLTRVLRDYRRKVNFDGLWLDMNEPEVFANARLIGADGHECPQDEELQYWPGNRRLSDRTLCMSAEFEKGKHFDLHNLYAFYQSKAHYEALRALNSTRRPFLVSRAQFVGQAKYAAAWLGDLGSSFEHMRYSLLATIESSWMGQPMTGGDICGFFGQTSDELCARWFSLGAFYSLARNHNDGTARDQDPGALAEFVQLAARVALLRRYSLLPFLYSRLYRNHLEGEPAVSSLEFAFFSQFDAPMEQFDNVDDQLVWGAALVVAPVLEAGAQSRSVRLPPGRWYDISIGLPRTDLSEGAYDALRSNWPTSTTTSTDSEQDERLRERLDRLRKPIDCPSGGKGCLLRDQFTPLGSLNLYLRGGQILPSFRRVEHTKSIDELWTDDPGFFLEIALDESASATGELLWDSGESAPDDKSYDEALFWAARNRLTLSMVTNNYKKELKFNGFVVYGAQLEATPEPRVFKNIRLQYGYDSERDILTCEFKSLSGDHDEQLVLVRFENLILRW